MTICIIGAGAAGLILLLLLQASAQDITIIDPHFDGGDLCRRWGSVVSNTRWEQALQALERYGPIPAWARQLSLQEPTPLATLGRLVREMAAPALRASRQIQASVTTASYTDGSWILQTSTGDIVQATVLCLTTGSDPKSLHLPIPSIPLDIALDPQRVRTYIQLTDSVLVFGLSHSGTLVLRNCLEAGAKEVIGVYRGAKPFLFARDGEYDGLKLDAAAAADGFVTSPPKALKLARCDDMSCLLAATRKADWVVYAIGFEARGSVSFTVNNESKRGPFTYDGATGQLRDLPAAYGFGLAYPSQAPDGVHWDVGITPFVDHINRQIPAILSLK
jgi:hypothetical protein